MSEGGLDDLRNRTSVQGLGPVPEGLPYLLHDYFETEDVSRFRRFDQGVTVGVFPRSLIVIRASEGSREGTSSEVTVYPLDRVEVKIQTRYKFPALSPGREVTADFDLRCVDATGDSQPVVSTQIPGTREANYVPWPL